MKNTATAGKRKRAEKWLKCYFYWLLYYTLWTRRCRLISFTRSSVYILCGQRFRGLWHPRLLPCVVTFPWHATFPRAHALLIFQFNELQKESLTLFFQNRRLGYKFSTFLSRPPPPSSRESSPYHLDIPINLEWLALSRKIYEKFNRATLFCWLWLRTLNLSALRPCRLIMSLGMAVVVGISFSLLFCCALSNYPSTE